MKPLSVTIAAPLAHELINRDRLAGVAVEWQGPRALISGEPKAFRKLAVDVEARAHARDPRIMRAARVALDRINEALANAV